MQIKEIMSHPIHTITPDISIERASIIMKEQGVGALPIIGDSGFMGMITDRDIVIRCIANDKDVFKTKVEECMTHNLVTVSEDESLEEAARKMSEAQVRRIVVLGSEQNPIGILDIEDLSKGVDTEEIVSETVKDVDQQVDRAS